MENRGEREQIILQEFAREIEIKSLVKRLYSEGARKREDPQAVSYFCPVIQVGAGEGSGIAGTFYTPFYEDLVVRGYRGTEENARKEQRDGYKKLLETMAEHSLYLESEEEDPHYPWASIIEFLPKS